MFMKSSRLTSQWTEILSLRNKYHTSNNNHTSYIANTSYIALLISKSSSALQRKSVLSTSHRNTGLESILRSHVHHTLHDAGSSLSRSCPAAIYLSCS